MYIKEILRLADELLLAKTGEHLDYLQEAILRGALEGKTYPPKMKQRVISSIRGFTHNTTAGRNFVWLKSVNGKFTKTISPFLSIIKPAPHLPAYRYQAHHAKNQKPPHFPPVY